MFWPGNEILYHLYPLDMPGLRMNASRLRKRRLQSGADLSPGTLHWDWWPRKIFHGFNEGYELTLKVHMLSFMNVVPHSILPPRQYGRFTKIQVSLSMHMFIHVFNNIL